MIPTFFREFMYSAVQIDPPVGILEIPSSDLIIPEKTNHVGDILGLNRSFYKISYASCDDTILICAMAGGENC